ncbi:MAG TPA: hypothetical protein VHC20_06750 [Candidatus Paceibacterota bacterium]|nr:hypothetical protein [Candidatus Paceibacterota bacterium]
MSARKAARDHKRGDKMKRTRRRTAAPTAGDIEDVRLALLGVYAVCDLVRAASMSYCVEVALTRGALQPLREALERLGQKNIEQLWWPTQTRRRAA